MKLFDIYGTLKLKGLDEAKKGLEDVSSQAKETGTTVNSVWSRMKASAGSVWNSIRSKAKSSFNGIGSDANSIAGRVRSAFSKIKMPAVVTTAFKSSLKSAEAVAKASVSRIQAILGSIKNGMNKLTGAISGSVGGWGTLLAGLGVAKATKEVFSYANSLDQARINWQVLMGSAEKGNEMLDRIQKFAKDTPFDFDSTQKFAQQLKIAGLNGDQLFKTMQVIGDAAQGNVEKAEGIATAYQQMSAKGKIQTEEMNQLLERGIPAWDMLAKATGKTKAELMDMASKGKLAADEYLPKLVDQMDKAFGGGMQMQAKTFQGQLDQLKDNFLQLGAKGIAPLREGLKHLMGDINDVFDGKISIGEMFSKWGKAIWDGLKSLGRSILDFDWGGLGNSIGKFIHDLFFNLGGSLGGLNFKSILSGLWSAFKGALELLFVDLPNFLGGLIISLITGMSTEEFISVAGDFFSNIGNWIKDKWNSLMQMFSGDSEGGIAEAISGWWDSITGSLSSFGSSIKEWFSSIWNSISETFSNFPEKAGERIASWWDGISSALSSWWNTVSEWFSTSFNQLVQWFADVPSKVASFGTWIWGAITGGLVAMWSMVSGWFTNCFNQFVEWFSQGAQKVASWGSWIWGAITGALSSMWSTVSSWFSNNFNQFVQWFQQGAQRVTAWGSWIWSSVTGTLSSLWYSVSSFFSNCFNQLVNWFQQGAYRVSSFGSWIWGAVSGGLYSLLGSISSIGRDIVYGVWNGIASMVGWFRSRIYNFFSNLVDSAKSALGINSPSRVFRDEVGHWVAPGIAEGIIKNSDVAIDSISSLSEQMVNAWDGEFNTNLTGYGTMSFDSETSAPFKTLSDKFDELSTAFRNIEFAGNINVDGEKLGEAVYMPLNNLIDEGGLF